MTGTRAVVEVDHDCYAAMLSSTSTEDELVPSSFKPASADAWLDLEVVLSTVEPYRSNAFASSG